MTMEKEFEIKFENKLKVDESILKEWEQWKSSDDQKTYELRYKAFEALRNCTKNLSIQKMNLSIVPNSMPYGLKALDISSNKLKQIPENLPKTLESLNIESNEVCAIPETLPDSIKFLNLSNNQITTIPHKLPKPLEVLIMNSNKICIIPDNLSTSLRQLLLQSNGIAIIPNTLPDSIIKLNLSFNKISTLPNKLPKSLEILNVASSFEHKYLVCFIPDNLPTNLRQLILTRNDITNIPNTLPDSITYLDLRGNNITILQNRLPKSLKVLDVSRNNISYLPTNLLESLEVLNVQENNLISLPEQLTNSLKILYASLNNLIKVKIHGESLTELHLENNQIEKIEYFNLPKLKLLYLENNRLTSLPEVLPEVLESLNVSYNQITHLPKRLPMFLKDLFAEGNELTKIKLNSESLIKLRLEGNKIETIEIYLPKLEELLLTSNHLTAISENFPETLIELNVNNNQIISLPERLPKSLQYLSANFNKITKLKGDFESLTFLILDHNEIKTVDYFHSPKLICLSLMDNQLARLPEILPQMLQALDVSNNQLICLPEQLPQTLEVLDVSNNQLICLPEQLPQTLLKLDVTNNQLICLPEQLPKSLEELNMGYNKLTKINMNYEHLVELNLENNEIHTIENFNIPQLSYLYLAQNQLTHLPEISPELLTKINEHRVIKFPKRLLALEELDIRDNHLVSLPELLLKSLKRLNAGNNQLNKVELDAELLTYLILDNNKIESIQCFKLPKIKYLELENNKLTVLPDNLSDTIQYLSASYNNISVIPNLPISLKCLMLNNNNISILPDSLPSQLSILHLTNNKLDKIPSKLPSFLVEFMLSENLITEVPSSIEDIPKAEIRLNDNPLSQKSKTYLQRLIFTTNRLNISFDNSSETYEDHVKIRPLIEELPYWLDDKTIYNNSYWNVISEETGAESLCLLLYKIRQSGVFEIQEFKDDISKFLHSLVAVDESKKKLREMVFLLAEEVDHRTSCGVVWLLNQMQTFNIILEVESGKYDDKVEELIKLGHGMYRLNILEQVSRQKIAKLRREEWMMYTDSDEDLLRFRYDEVLFILQYQIRLRDILQLPIDTWKFIHKIDNYTLSEDDIELAIQTLKNKQLSEFIDFLLIDWQPWKEILKRWNYEKFTKSKNDIKNEELFQQKLNERKIEYLRETNLSELPLEIETQLGSQIQRSIEKDIWYRLTNEFLKNMEINLETLI